MEEECCTEKIKAITCKQVTAPAGETFVKFGKLSNATVLLSSELKALHPVYRDDTDYRKEK